MVPLSPCRPLTAPPTDAEQTNIPQEVTKSSNPKQGDLKPTAQTWISHMQHQISLAFWGSISPTSKASSTLPDAVIMLNSQINKHATFHTPLQTTLPETPAKPHSMLKPKPTLKIPTPSNMQTIPNQAKMASPTTAGANNSVSLKKASPQSFDTIRDIPGTHTICTDLNVPHIQHIQR